MLTDAELLLRYVEQRDESSFAQLVQRHLGLVYSAALRRTGGRVHLAEDISQKVFADLSRKAATLVSHPTLTGWLYRSTRYVAIDAIRAEQRQQKLAQSLITMADTEPVSKPPVDWEAIRPVIDQVLDQLKAADREAVLLRYLNGLSFAEVGERLDVSENAARMRTERALEKLRRALGQRGLASTTAALGVLLAHPAFASAPAGLAAAVTSTAISAAPVTSATAALTTFFLMSKVTAPVVSAAIAAALTVVIWTSTAEGVTSAQLAILRQENARLTAAIAPGATAESLAPVADAFGATAAAIVRAMDQRLAGNASSSTAKGTASNAAPSSPAPSPRGHRFHGQSTPKDAHLSNAWASDAGEVEALSKLLYFEPKLRERAAAILAGMPASVQERYPTPEEFYAFLMVVDSLVAPPPGPEVLETWETVELSEERRSVRWPGAKGGGYLYQSTPDGWKWVFPEIGVELWPGNLTDELLVKLTTR